MSRQFIAWGLLVLCGVRPLPATDDTFPFIVTPTSVIEGPPENPRVLLALRPRRAIEGFLGLTVHDAAGNPIGEMTPERDVLGKFLLPVPLPAAAETGKVRLEVTDRAGVHRIDVSYPRPDDDWVLHFIPGFHYDPVWWNTQAHYTETGKHLDSHVGPGLELVEEYLEICERDPDYRVALHQLPYLKTFLEARPQEVVRLAALIRDGRCALVGGSYNELQSTLISAEACARNAIYGTLFQKEILGEAETIFWQCDAFGHDPSFPSLMARCGHTAGAFARGPFHQWGAPRDQVNFASEFLWMAPDGTQILTHYMTGHYGYAYARFAAGTNRAPEGTERCHVLLTEMFEDLRRPALTHHILLPMHTDFVRPLENLGDVVRRWNATMRSPKAIISTPEAFFAAVRSEVVARDLALPVVTRDMNPIYTGCPVSFADLKLAERACEVVLRDAEVFATVASWEGALYPSLALDRAWRQLLFNAHHDGVTGSMSDQVYLDVLAGYRDAWELAREVRERSLEVLSREVPVLAGESLLWNSLSAPRRGAVSAETSTGTRRVVWVERTPGVGYSVVRDSDPERAPPGGREDELENEFLRVRIDRERGGTLASVFDKRTGRELLRAAGHDLVLVEEYAVLPGHGEGPWHLSPTGKRRSGVGVEAKISRAPDRPYARIVEAHYPEYRTRQTIELLPGSSRLDCETEILGWTGRNQLLRIEFPLHVRGARPVFETAAAVIGRPFSRDVNTAEDPWTLDQTCWQWVDLGTTLTVDVSVGGAIVHRRALSVGEIVVAANAPTATVEAAGRFAAALVKCGVTTTITREGGRRYGDLRYDSNVPDFRVLWGTAATHRGIAALIAEHGFPAGIACALVEDRQGFSTLIVQPPHHALYRSLENGQRIIAEDARVPRPEVAADYGVALLNAGPVSVQVSEAGTVGLNLLRSTTSWPAGVWIDPPRRRLPDGAPFGTMHGSHVFRYSLVPHEGDFRRAKLARVGQAFNHPPLIRRGPPSSPLPSEGAARWRSYLEVYPPTVLLTALKPEGFAEARWSTSDPPTRAKTYVARLWNGAGREVLAAMRSAVPATKAWRADLLERRQEPLKISQDLVLIPMAPNAVETVLVECELRPARVDTPSLDPTEGDVSPSAYWLENLGEGVTGNGVLSIVPGRREIVLEEREARTAIEVVNNHLNDPVTVSLALENSRYLEVELERYEVRVEPRDTVTVRMHVRCPRPMPVPPTLVTVIASGLGGRSVTAAIWVRGPESDGDVPAVEIVNTAPVVAGGESLRAQIRNLTLGPVSGLARWISPFATWRIVGDWRRRITIPAGETVDVECPLKGSIDSFALLTFAYGGRVSYGESVALTSDPRRIILSFAVDRIRLRPGEPNRVAVTAASALRESTALEIPITLRGPELWQVSEKERSVTSRGVVEVAYEVIPPFEGSESTGVLTAVASSENPASVTVPYTLAPRQFAHRTEELVAVDGDLGEWSPDEFTTATSALGVVRTAVRYGGAGLALALEVEDDHFVQTHAGATIWEGDSIQVGLSEAPSSVLGYGQSDLEFGAALTPGGSLVWCWYAREGRATGRVEEAEVEIRHEEGAIRYELRLPRSILPPTALQPGAVLGFTYIANDDDGEGYRGATEWTPGMTGAKDASLFGELLLVAE